MKTSGGNRLDPSVLRRLRDALSPGRRPSLAIRRTVAAVLAAAAVAVAVADRRAPDWPAVPVAARDLRPGAPLTDADVELRAVPPDQARHAPALSEVTGRRLTGPIGRGEMVTRSRLLDPRLPAVLTGNSRARLVPVEPTDSAISEMLRTGDLVDVLDADGRVLAHGAIVALAAGSRSAAPGAPSGPVLLAMDQRAAHRVASAALDARITFVLH